MSKERPCPRQYWPRGLDAGVHELDHQPEYDREHRCDDESYSRAHTKMMTHKRHQPKKEGHECFPRLGDLTSIESCSCRRRSRSRCCGRRSGRRSRRQRTAGVGAGVGEGVGLKAGVREAASSSEMEWKGPEAARTPVALAPAVLPHRKQHAGAREGESREPPHQA